MAAIVLKTLATSKLTSYLSPSQLTRRNEPEAILTIIENIRKVDRRLLKQHGRRDTAISTVEAVLRVLDEPKGSISFSKTL